MQDHVPWAVEWRRHCEQAAQRAQAFIAAHEVLREHTEHGLLALQRQHETRVAQLESRIARLSGAAQAAECRDLDSEGAQRALLAEAIRHPAVRTDVAGALFISATTPFVQ
jgi:ATP-dependent helicase HepA